MLFCKCACGRLAPLGGTEWEKHALQTRANGGSNPETLAKHTVFELCSAIPNFDYAHRKK